MVPARAVGDGLVPSRPRGVHDCDTGDDKHRPYKVPFDIGHGLARAVGDALVASRFETVHGLDTGDDKRRPYESGAGSAASGFVPWKRPSGPARYTENSGQ